MMVSTKCDDSSYQSDSVCISACALCYHNYSKFKTLNYYKVMLYYSLANANQVDNFNV